MNITILLFNNRIYGLTKGQYSPTSEAGKITKSTPVGSIDTPFDPMSLALGAQAGFVARTHDMDRAHMQETFRRASEHKGASFVEVYQNCNVFNDAAYEAITGKANRDSMLIQLRHGEPIRFGTESEFGVFRRDDGSVYTDHVTDANASSVIVHDESTPDPTAAFALARLTHSDHEPTPMGVFRDVSRPEYGEAVTTQIESVRSAKGQGDLAALLRSNGSWSVQ